LPVIGAFQKLIVGGVLRHLERTLGLTEWECRAKNGLEELQPEALANLKLGACEDLPVFGKNGIGDIEPCRLGDSKQENGALQSAGFQGRRDDDVCIDYQPERDHPRLGFSARVD
jgi:hypothetical protein